MTIAQVLSALQLGLLYGILALGLYIPFRILNIADMTVQGTFTMGMIIAAVFAYNDLTFLGILFAIIGGALSGVVTGILHTKFNIPSILSGILTMTGLYTINLIIAAGKANISLIGKNTIYSSFNSLFNNEMVTKTLVTLVIVVIVTVAIAVFFHTRTGLTIRATGDNAAMVRHTSINTDNMNIIGLALGNAMAALSGAMICHYNLFADVNSGTGILVVALAAIIIGETLFRRNGVTLGLISTVIGSIVYRFIIAIALKFDVLPSYALNLISTIIVIIALMFPTLKDARDRGKKKRLHKELADYWLNDENNLQTVNPENANEFRTDAANDINMIETMEEAKDD